MGRQHPNGLQSCRPGLHQVVSCDNDYRGRPGDRRRGRIDHFIPRRPSRCRSGMAGRARWPRTQLHGLGRRRRRRVVRAGDSQPDDRSIDDQPMPAVKWTSGFLIAFAAAPAAAHDPSGALSSASTWSYDPWLLAPLYLVGIGFYVGTQKVWAAAGFDHGVHRRQVAAFWAGWLVLGLAITS